MSDLHNNIIIETSISDALDRLSILHIKSIKITDDNKLQNINYEMELLNNKLKKHISKVVFFYNTLININTKIWELLDEAKYQNNHPAKRLELFLEQEDYNERRFRVKSKIDAILESNIKEQKGYKHKKAMVLGHLGMGDQFYIVGMIRYLATIYDEVLVVCKDNTQNNIKQMYSDDITIKTLSVPDDNSISPAYGAPIQKFNEIFNGYRKYLLGFHQHGIRNNSYGQGKIIYDLPFSFYDDVQINYQIFWDYFHVNKSENSLTLYNSIKDNNISKYIFVHNTSSIGEVFSLDFVIDKFNIDIDNVLIVNPSVSMYESRNNNNDISNNSVDSDISNNSIHHNNKYYNIAKSFLDLPILVYIDLIENADIVIMSDSSFLAMAQHLEIKTDKCYMYCRTGESYNYTYDHIWSDKYRCRSTPNKFKKFTQIN